MRPVTEKPLEATALEFFVIQVMDHLGGGGVKVGVLVVDSVSEAQAACPFCLGRQFS